MSDPSDALAEAMALNRRLAASRLVMKQELEAELAKRQSERLLLEAEGPEAQPLRDQVDARIAQIGVELQAADRELKAALAEIKELGRLSSSSASDAARAFVAAVTAAPDPVLRSLEESALDNARSHLSSLEAQIRVGAELAELDGGAPPAVPALPKPKSREQADAEALAEFQALRAGREKPPQ